MGILGTNILLAWGGSRGTTGLIRRARHVSPAGAAPWKRLQGNSTPGCCWTEGWRGAGWMVVLLQASQELPLCCFPKRAFDGPFCFSRISRQQQAGGDGARGPGAAPRAGTARPCPRDGPDPRPLPGAGSVARGLSRGRVTDRSQLERFTKDLAAARRIHVNPRNSRAKSPHGALPQGPRRLPPLRGRRGCPPRAGERGPSSARPGPARAGLWRPLAAAAGGGGEAAGPGPGTAPPPACRAPGARGGDGGGGSRSSPGRH